ncbi:hypothetical protein RA263_01310 [Pseudomonas syringae pv. tagetis]|uniref:Uncharacterized protein n=1 Tax=Pseudomonas syringae pv. tagetis TaxID=129140 RepID=A0ABW7NIR6_9PSED|nr:hypothetical protein [Pseudomonas syringae group genomosp. 7]UNB62123.1 hypothetical protein MME54_21220 [Pseudomonas syringae pv. helianthi]UNB69789.1 hypothetical protein MME58_05955 [Pseudomonas syringae pv. tagetis]
MGGNVLNVSTLRGVLAIPVPCQADIPEKAPYIPRRRKAESFQLLTFITAISYGTGLHPMTLSL